MAAIASAWITLRSVCRNNHTATVRVQGTDERMLKRLTELAELCPCSKCGAAVECKVQDENTGSVGA